MLEFKQNDTSTPLILTLTETVSVADPYFLFIFSHVVTKEEVIFLKFNGDDESNHPERYNQFTIDPSVIFAGRPPGEWHYQINEQVSSINLDPALSGDVLEFGKLMVLRSTEFAFEKYDTATTYKAYNG